MTRIGTLLVLLSLGPFATGLAHADDPPQEERAPPSPPPHATADSLEMVSGSMSSVRGVAQDYLVLPRGSELSGDMKFITADPSLGGAALKFSDLALFTLSGRKAIAKRVEVDASVTLLPKQPSYTDEKPWQSVDFAARVAVTRRVAIALSGGGGHLLDHGGEWTHEAVMVETRKRLNELVSFDLRGGVDLITLSSADTNMATLTEVAVSTAAHFREPTGHWGAWLGMSYAVPLSSSGMDPTTNLALDPQPRLDFHVGNAWSPVPSWDLYFDFAVIDRGDLVNPATRLPILDGGFDQRQIVFGVVRHFSGRHHRNYEEPSRDDEGSDNDGGLILGSR